MIEIEKKDLQNYRFIDLFSGLGAFRLALESLGAECVFSSEINQSARDVYLKNFGEEPVGDITNVDEKKIPEHDILCAGFPCQAFSISGKQRGFEDSRGTLFFDVARIVKVKRPKVVFLENVRQFATHDGGKTLKVVKQTMEDLGYTFHQKVLNAVDYGIPQKRERLIILGVKKHLNKELSFPEELNTNVDLKSIVKFNMTGAIKIEPEDFDMTTIPEECILTDLNNDETENNVHPYLKVLAKDKNYEYNNVTYPRRLSFSKRDSAVHGEIIDIRKPSKTIICTYNHQPRLFVPLKNKNGYYLRCLLPDELKQIQGFPEDFILTGSTKDQIIQIGNAVPPILIKQIIEHSIL